MCSRTWHRWAPTRAVVTEPRPEEHERCPYCFGHEGQVLGGRHEEFCDYRRGVDPVSFGLPTDVQRHEHG